MVNCVWLQLCLSALIAPKLLLILSSLNSFDAPYGGHVIIEYLVSTELSFHRRLETGQWVEVVSNIMWQLTYCIQKTHVSGSTEWKKTANSFSISETHIIYVLNSTLIEMCTGAIILPGFHSVSVCNAVTWRWWCHRGPDQQFAAAFCDDAASTALRISCRCNSALHAQFRAPDVLPADVISVLHCVHEKSNPLDNVR